MVELLVGQFVVVVVLLRSMAGSYLRSVDVGFATCHGSALLKQAISVQYRGVPSIAHERGRQNDRKRRQTAKPIYAEQFVGQGLGRTLALAIKLTQLGSACN